MWPSFLRRSPLIFLAVAFVALTVFLAHDAPSAHGQETNRAPTVASAIEDATIVNEIGTQQVSLSGMFDDADNDSLTVTATSSDELVAIPYVATDYSMLTVFAVTQGIATIKVTADDGNGGTVSDIFTVTVKAAPTVASALADVAGLEEDSTRDVSLSGVFSDADGDALTITASSSNDTKATISVAPDGSSLTVAGVAEGTATIPVTAQDSDGNRVSDAFDVSVVPATEQGEQITIPGPVLNLELTATVDTISVTWQAPESGGAPSRYIAHIKPEGGGKGATKRPKAKKTTVTFKKLESGTTYKVWVRAQNEAGKGERVHASITLPDAESEQEDGQQQQEPPNQAPMVASAIGDATIINESGSKQVSLSGVFSDADNDSLTITALSSDDAKATVSVASDQSSLTVTAKARGTATITVTANDGNGGTVSDSFTVKVKAAPTVASGLADVTSLEEDSTQLLSLAGVFSDADGDALTITASSSDDTKAIFSIALDGSSLTVRGVAEGTATITVTAQDSDGNGVSDGFDVSVVAAPQQQQQGNTNRAPTVASAIADATIVNESGTQQVSLSGVFDDADNDSLTITALSSDDAKATVSVASDQSSLTVAAKARGTATITVTADDGNGGTTSDTFTVTVKAAPTVASAWSDFCCLTVGFRYSGSVDDVFSDADGDSLTITAASSDDEVVKVWVQVLDDGRCRLWEYAVAKGTATITLTAEDSDGNTVSDTHQATVIEIPKGD